MKPVRNRILTLLLLMIAVFALAACETETNNPADYTPEIQGLPEDLTFEMKKGDVFDPLVNVYAFDPVDGDISSSMYIEGLADLQLDTAKRLTKTGTFQIKFVAINSGGRSTEVEATVIVTDFFEELAKYDVGDYELVWFDEFDYVGAPDSDKWNLTVAGNGFGNFEIQYYTDREENVYVDGEYLTIKLIKEEYEHLDYTSAKLTSKDKGFWTYGKIEIMAKLPEGKGTWPAIWMMPNENTYGGWPASGEIDIMEHVGYDQNRIYGTVHTKAYNGVFGNQRGGNTKIETATTEFHKYSIEWLPNKIIYSVDDEPYYTYNYIVDIYSDYEEKDYWRVWPFNHDMYLIMNLAFGGTWGGAQGIDETLTEAEMVIDYVRVYQGTGLTEE